jgi:hypothetical protein
MYNMKTIKGLLLAGMIGFTGLLAGCGGGGAGGSSTTPVSATASSLELATTATSVNSANSDSVTITATAKSAGNVAMSNQTVQFSTSTGSIVTATTTTDANGKITATFSAGTLEKTNRTAIITATVSGTSVTASIPIQITGSTLTSSATVSTLTAGTPVTLTATAKISGGSAAGSQTLRFTIAASSTGSGTLSAASATTDSNGNATVTFTGTAAGVVNVLIEWLESSTSSNSTLSITRTFNVQPAGAAFEVTTPASSPAPVSLGATQAVTVTTPATINGISVANIRYATTLGSWNASPGPKTLTVARTGASDTETFHAGSNSGNANIQIDALDGTGAVLATAKMIFALSATVASVNSITLQSNVSSLAPSSGGTTSTATLTATVKDAALNAVGGASVLFELVNPTGSGEQIDPVVVSTNSSGIAQSIFTAGTSTLQTSKIKASVIGSAITPSTINITVGGTAGSVAIGTSTKIASVNSDTSYQLPTTVMVTDSNGNAVSGATVSLKLWGLKYHKGSRPKVSDACPASVTFTHVNEDANENLTRDAGEDVDGPGNPTGLGTADLALWPPSPAAGSIPSTVTTGSDGTATFNWVYLKQYADWVTARLRASVLVQGSEATTTTTITLAPSKEDVGACVLPVSPFN